MIPRFLADENITPALVHGLRRRFGGRTSWPLIAGVSDADEFAKQIAYLSAPLIYSRSFS